MNKTTKRAYALYPVIALFLAGIVILNVSIFVNGETWASNRVNSHIYSGGELADAGTIYDRDGTVLAESEDGERVFAYSERLRRSTLHIVGDSAGRISTGVQTVFRGDLTGYSFVDGVYNLKHYGRGSDITLTIDGETSKTAYDALGGRNGIVAAYNYLTGELLCCVSAPTYDPEDVPEDILTNKDFSGVYLNRLYSGVYTPGSVFKCVTAACAIENIPDIFTQTFKCEGKWKLGSGEIICSGTHGEQTFGEAFGNSCNCAFAQIGAQLGAEKLAATAKEMGFNTSFRTRDGIKLAISRFSLEGASKLDLGWAAVGQYDTLLNPCHMLMLMGAAANGGKGIEPHIVKSIDYPNGNEKENDPGILWNTGITMKETTANILAKMLRSNVDDFYGDGNFYDLEMCGKTGTAELDDGEPHSWFAGFSKDTSFPVAVVVVVENGGSGYRQAVPIANEVLQELRDEF